MKLEKMRLVIAIIVVAAICFGSAVYYRQSTHEAIDAMTYDTLSASATEQSQVFRTALDGQYAVLETFAQLAGTENFENQEQAAAWLNKAKEPIQTHFTFIAMGNAAGEAVYHSGKVETLSTNGYKRALRGERSAELIDNARFDGSPYIVIYGPIVDGGKTVGVVLAGYELDIFREMLTNEAYDGNAYSFLCDSSGNVIINSFHANAIKGMGNVFTQLEASKVENETVEQLKARLESDGSAVVHYEYNGEKNYAGFERVGINDWYIVSVVPARFVSERSQSVTTSGWISLAIIAVVFMAAAIALVLHERKIISYSHASKVDLMMGQIKPHFMYNTFSAIIALIDIDPKRAKKMVMDFSKYMRNNIDVLSMDKMASFKSEIAHTKAYVAIEQVRFPDEITVEYEIGAEDFLIPPLTVQPLVENAIKHGIHVKHGGTVVIRTAETDKGFVLTVADNGAGFDAIGKSKKPTGIDNVRFRLKKMCSGTLEIKSKPGEGTLVTVTVPKSNKVAPDDGHVI